MQRRTLKSETQNSGTTSAEAIIELPLHLKYRPRTFQQVYGQPDIIKSLESALKAPGRPHSYLFTGESGTGKTTLARIMAGRLEVDPANIVEIDAASNSGIDAMKDVIAPLRYHSLGASKNKAVLVDECQRLSAQTWDSMLKIIEEPPEHVYFFFCTTNAGKVPAAIVTRCQAYNLRPCKHSDIFDLLWAVCDIEDLPPPDRYLTMIAQACNGSPRQALVMLATVAQCTDEDEVQRLLEMPLDNKEIIDLCRQLVKGELTWETLTKTLKGLGDMPAESIRIVVVNYLNACLMGARSDRDACRLLDMLQCFTTPGQQSDKLAPILLAFGRYIFPA